MRPRCQFSMKKRRKRRRRDKKSRISKDGHKRKLEEGERKL